MKFEFKSGPASGKTLEVASTPTVIGREAGVGFQVEDDEISRRHAEIRLLDDGTAEINDLGSRNGTFVDGKKIEGPTVLRGGEEIRIGQSTITAEAAAIAAPDVTAAATPAPPPPPPSEPAAPKEPAPPEPVAPKEPTAEMPAEPEKPAEAAKPAAAAAAKDDLSQASGGQKPAPGQSTIQRILLRRSVKRANYIAGAAVLVALLAGGAAALAVLGVFSEDEPSAAEVAKEAEPGTVIVVSNKSGIRQGSGTGWVVNADQGLIVTNAHVTDVGETFQVGNDEGLEDAELVASAPCADLSVLHTDAADDLGLETLPLGDQDSIENGDEVLVLGYPINANPEDDLVVTSGHVSNPDTRYVVEESPFFQEYPHVVQHDATINHGNSGGPLVNQDGEVIGINTLLFTDPETGERIEGQDYSIAIGYAEDIIRDLAAGNGHGWAGYAFNDYSTSPPGVIVSTAVPDSPGAEAGFGSVPRVITAVNGAPVPTLQDYCDATEDLREGDTADITYAESSFGPETTVGVEFE
jgi:S1-C subfamily serine protease